MSWLPVEFILFLAAAAAMGWVSCSVAAHLESRWVQETARIDAFLESEACRHPSHRGGTQGPCLSCDAAARAASLNTSA